jgi:hypothetical protein
MNRLFFHLQMVGLLGFALAAPATHAAFSQGFLFSHIKTEAREAEPSAVAWVWNAVPELVLRTEAAPEPAGSREAVPASPGGTLELGGQDGIEEAKRAFSANPTLTDRYEERPFERF